MSAHQTDRNVAGRILGDRYMLLSPVAQGGMGEVWKARDRESGHIVAAKVLRPELLGEELSLSRLRLEARNAMRVQHPNIASVLDSGEDLGRGWIIMELVEGRPLTDYVRAGQRLSVADLIPLLIQVAMALNAAAQADVVHRDIKPANVVIRPDGVVKLTDFGISRTRDQASLTAAGMVMGTAQYLPPEQAMGHVATAAGDLYALGIIAYEAVAGKRPFTGTTQVDIAFSHVNDPVPPLPADVPPPFAAVVMHLLQKDPKNRPESGAALVRELVAAAHTMALSVAPHPLPTPAGEESSMPTAQQPVVPPVAHTPKRSLPPSLTDPIDEGGTPSRSSEDRQGQRTSRAEAVATGAASAGAGTAAIDSAPRASTPPSASAHSVSPDRDPHSYTGPRRRTSVGAAQGTPGPNDGAPSGAKMPLTGPSDSPAPDARPKGANGDLVDTGQRSELSRVSRERAVRLAAEGTRTRAASASSVRSYGPPPVTPPPIPTVRTSAAPAVSSEPATASQPPSIRPQTQRPEAARPQAPRHVEISAAPVPSATPRRFRPLSSGATSAPAAAAAAAAETTRHTPSAPRPVTRTSLAGRRSSTGASPSSMTPSSPHWRRVSRASVEDAAPARTKLVRTKYNRSVIAPPVPLKDRIGRAVVIALIVLAVVLIAIATVINRFGSLSSIMGMGAQVIQEARTWSIPWPTV